MNEDDLLYFNENKLSSPSPSYVAWVDMMGTRNAMSQSLASSANHIGRIHAAIIRAKRPGLKVYPVLDGAYITAEKQKTIMDSLKAVFTECAKYFAAQATPEHRFLIRGGLAYGPVIHGSEINKHCNKELGEDPDYRKNLLFGMPMVQANRGEGNAPPFGMFIDESARAFGADGKTFSGLWFKWWKDSPPVGFTKRLQEHFEWAEAHSHGIGYDEKSLKAHYKMARQYFGIQAPKSSESDPQATECAQGASED